MKIKSRNGFAGSDYRFSFYLLAFLWTFGLFSGMIIASKAELNIDSRMCVYLLDSVSIPGLLISMLLPFIISLVAIRFRLIYPILFLALLKSFIYGFGRCIMVKVFLGAGWLVNIFYFFSDTLSAFVLLLYWSQGMQRQGRWLLRSTGISVVAVICVCCFDYFVVAPLLSDILA